jgi:hypothetical protein
MPYAFVRTAVVEADGGSTQTTAAFGANMTAGNLIVVWVKFNTYSTDPSGMTLTADGGRTWNAETPISLGGGRTLYCFYAYNISGGSTTGVTATTDDAKVGDWNIVAAEYSGIKSSGNPRLAFAGQLSYPGTGTDACSSGLLGTLSTQPALLVGVAQASSGTFGCAAGTGFTDRGVLWTTRQGRHEDKRLTATTSVAATFTLSPDNPYGVAAWAFEEGSGDSIVPPTTRLACIGIG